MVTLNFTGRTENRNHTPILYKDEIVWARSAIRDDIIGGKEYEYCILPKFKKHFEDFIGFTGIKVIG